MKIWLFYAKWGICFPHVWELIAQDSTHNYYQCAICGKKKKKRKRKNESK